MRPATIGVIVVTNLVIAVAGLRSMPEGLAAYPGGESFNQGRMAVRVIKTKLFEQLSHVLPAAPKTRNDSKRSASSTQLFLSASKDRVKRQKHNRMDGAKFLSTK